MTAKEYQSLRSKRMLKKSSRRSKYGAVRTNGYASKAEAKRAGELKLLERAAAIHSLIERPRYIIIDKSEFGRAIHFTGDFEYVDSKTGQTIVEDVKGNAKIVSRDWPLRARLFRERYIDIELRVVER